MDTASEILRLACRPPTDHLPSRSRCSGVCGVLFPTFRADEMVFFIPWRVVAEALGAAQLDLLGRLGGAAAAAGRTMVMSPAAPNPFQ